MFDAKKQLMQLGNGCGSFLVWYSDNSHGKYALSIRKVERVKHYRIFKLVDRNFYLNSGANIETIPAML